MRKEGPRLQPLLSSAVFAARIAPDPGKETKRLQVLGSCHAALWVRLGRTVVWATEGWSGLRGTRACPGLDRGHRTTVLGSFSFLHGLEVEGGLSE